MKLRAIELTDIRRFAGQTVRLGEIGEGVSVLAAPNEAGKSTVFDALHAVLFERHTGRPAAIRSLQPHAGGAPRVALEVEVDGARHRIEKRWLSAPQARVLGPDGSLIAQADQAEGWIDDRLGARLRGPSGLLWIRQGRAEFDRKDDPGARRDILSQVAGEIDAMTGGRRMDAVLARVAAALEPMVTPGGKPRARGPLDEALAEVGRLEREVAELTASVADLSQALADRQRAQRRRAELDDPQAAADRAARLSRARAEAEALRLHAERRDKAALALRMAQAAQAGAIDARDRLRALADDLGAADLALQQAEAEVAQRRARAEADRQAATHARARADAAARSLAALRQRQGAALRRQQARSAAAQAAELAERLARIDAALARTAEAEVARAAIPATAEGVERARRAAADLAELTARAEARAVTLRFAYTGAQRALRDGQPVEGDQRLTQPVRFDLPGLGTLTVEPGAADATAARLPAARAALALALQDCGADSLAGAVAALAQAEDLVQQARAARQLAAALAPEGVEALRQALARAQALAATGSEGDDEPDMLLAALAQAEPAAATAEAEARAAEAAAARADQDLAAAAATAAAARQRQAQAQARRGPEGDHAAALARADAGAQAAAEALEQARAEAAALDRAAPDADTIAARLAQAEGAVRQHAEERAALDVTLAGLRARIETMADQGIEESLADAQGRLTAARALAQARQDEVAALQRLRAALDAARASARTAYLAPVVQELAPMLALLHPDARLALDDASLQPAQLERGGQAEAIDILSGGTREQIAVLTRLAFARLFARTGRSLPVILDDALVQTDDERIEAMFTVRPRASR
jgi:DNA repair exonuclease SbcCD ATPase subunit